MLYFIAMTLKLPYALFTVNNTVYWNNDDRL